MPVYDGFDLNLEKLSSLLDQLPAAVSILDLDARLAYYSENAPNFVNRKPEFLGQDIRNCHKLQSSNERIDAIIEGFKAGNREPVSYIANPYGEDLRITIVPFIVNDTLLGCIQHVVKKESE